MNKNLELNFRTPILCLLSILCTLLYIDVLMYIHINTGRNLPAIRYIHCEYRINRLVIKIKKLSVPEYLVKIVKVDQELSNRRVPSIV